MGHLKVTVGHLRVTIGYLRVTVGHLRVTIRQTQLTTELHPKVRQTCPYYVWNVKKVNSEVHKSISKAFCYKVAKTG